MPGNWLFLGPPGGLYQFGLRQYSNIYIYIYVYILSYIKIYYYYNYVY